MTQIIKFEDLTDTAFRRMNSRQLRELIKELRRKPDGQYKRVIKQIDARLVEIEEKTERKKKDRAISIRRAFGFLGRKRRRR